MSESWEVFNGHWQPKYYTLRKNNKVHFTPVQRIHLLWVITDNHLTCEILNPLSVKRCVFVPILASCSEILCNIDQRAFCLKRQGISRTLAESGLIIAFLASMMRSYAGHFIRLKVIERKYFRILVFLQEVNYRNWTRESKCEYYVMEKGGNNSFFLT